MNRKLTAFTNGLELFSAALMLLAALRADGGLPFWLPMALTAVTAGIWGCVQRMAATFADVPSAQYPRLQHNPARLPSSPSPKPDKQNTVCPAGIRCFFG